MDITQFLNSVYANITSKTEKKSITPVIVGNTFRDLAELTKANVEAIGTDFAPVSGSTNYIQNIPSSGTVQNAGIKISDAIILGNNKVVIDSDGSALFNGTTGAVSIQGGDHISITLSGKSRSIKVDSSQPNGNFTHFLPAKNGTLATLADIPTGTTNTLQTVTENGAITTKDITANSFKLITKSGVNGFEIGNNTQNNNFYIWDSNLNIDRFVINNNGKVGIGTINPVETLDVVGKIRASVAPTNATDVIRLIDLSGYTNITGTTGTLQTVTDGTGKNITNNTLQVVGAGNVDLTKDGTIINNSGIFKVVGSTVYGNLVLDNNNTQFSYKSGSAITLRDQDNNNAGSFFNTRVSAQQAIATNELTTLGQVLTLVGTGSTNYSFSNGLRKSGSTVKLGLDLSDPTYTSGVLTEDLYLLKGDLVNNKYKGISITDSQTSLSSSSGTSLYSFQIDANAQTIGFVSNINGLATGIAVRELDMIVTDDNSNFGFKYKYDYSVKGKLDDRWIPDWGTVKTIIPTGSTFTGYSFANGIKLTGSTVRLGLRSLALSGDTNSGSLIDDTYLYRPHPTFANSYLALGLTGSQGNFHQQLDVSGILYKLGLNLAGNSMYLQKSVTITGTTTLQNVNFVADTHQMLITDNIISKGFEEAADYSAQKTDYSYVTKKMLLSATSGGSTYTFANGLRKSGSTVKLGLDINTNEGILSEPTYLFHGNINLNDARGLQIDQDNIYLTSSTGNTSNSNIKLHKRDGIKLYRTIGDQQQEIGFGGFSGSINNNLLYVNDSVNLKGFEEVEDYSAQKTDYSYVTKKMLDLKPDLLNGLIPLELIPELDIEHLPDSFLSTTEFIEINNVIVINKTFLDTYIDNRIALANNGNINPPAPTNGIVDDENDTWTVTPPSGYTGTDLETSVNNGITWVNNSGNTFYVGNFAKSIGQVQTRVKASSGRNPGAILSNPIPFTSSGSGSGYVDLTSWIPGDSNAIPSGNTINFLQASRARSNKQIILGNEGGLKAISNDAGFGLGVYNSFPGRNEVLIGMSQDPNNLKVVVFSNGTNLFETSLGQPINSILEIIITSDNFISKVNGNTIYTYPINISGSYEAVCFGYGDNTSIHDIQQIGFA